MTPEEKKELEKQENENLKIIEAVYNAVIKDKGIQKQIEQTKGHEWVRMVEVTNNE